MNQQTISSHQYPWLTMNNLLEINPSHLEMRETKFTNEEMNLFIRNWINGGNSNLRSLAFRLNNLNLETILNGIPSVLRTAPGSMPYNWCPLSSFYSLFSVLPPELITFCFDQFFEIRNVNGVVASIVVERVANDDFILLTWPDYKGQPYPVELIV
uniref:FBA_2 domain-containing protein n=1 Tax=Caenorhabditis tropicalis TaxID=1561998 RepID=A0A1I7UMK3_9PELO